MIVMMYGCMKLSYTCTCTGSKVKARMLMHLVDSEFERQ